MRDQRRDRSFLLIRWASADPESSGRTSDLTDRGPFIRRSHVFRAGNIGGGLRDLWKIWLKTKKVTWRWKFGGKDGSSIIKGWLDFFSSSLGPGGKSHVFKNYRGADRGRAWRVRSKRSYPLRRVKRSADPGVEEHHHRTQNLTEKNLQDRVKQDQGRNTVSGTPGGSAC